jgi:hypothetical protein
MTSKQSRDSKQNENGHGTGFHYRSNISTDMEKKYIFLWLKNFTFSDFSIETKAF